MKKTLIIFLLIALLIGCTNKPKTVRKVDHMLYLKYNDPMEYEAEMNGYSSWDEYIDSLDKELKDVPFENAHGEYVPMRSSDKSKPDTVVDGIHYRRI